MQNKTNKTTYANFTWLFQARSCCEGLTFVNLWTIREVLAVTRLAASLHCKDNSGELTKKHF